MLGSENGLEPEKFLARLRELDTLREDLNQLVECINCGVEFETGNYNKRVCSLECAQEAGIRLVVCAYCGMEFETTHLRKKTCSKECKCEWIKNRTKEYKARPEVCERYREWNKNNYLKKKFARKLVRSERILREIKLFPEDVDRNAFGYWLSGFVDGEGSFSLGIYKDKKRPGCLIRRAEFVIGLRDDDDGILKLIQSYWACGSIYYGTKVSKRDNKVNPYVSYYVGDIVDLMNIVVPHFEKFTLRAKKHQDFTVWRQGVELLHEIKNRPFVRLGRFEQRWTDVDKERFLVFVTTLKEVRKYVSRSTRSNNGDQVK